MTAESTSNDVLSNDFDDSINLESKVLLALLRLQNRKNSSKRNREPRAVSCAKVVQFLKANYCWLDGDIQSQVKTALLSFVKIGIVCALDSAKYRLIIPNSKVMTSNCTTRFIHGPQCCCLFTLKCLKSNQRNVCCLLKNSGGEIRKINMTTKRKNKRKTPVSRGSGNARSSSRKSRKIKCLLKKDSGTADRKNSSSSKCFYCSESHPPEKPKTCGNCNSDGETCGVPTNVFSPRDEPTKTSY